MNTFIEVLGVTDALVFILYILIIISIGFFASRKVKNAKDFSTAGQSLTPLVLISSFLATFFGAFSGSGAMEMVGMFGLTAITILFSSNVGWFIMSLMAKNMRSSGALTYPEYIRCLAGDDARVASSSISMVYLIGQIAGQFVACGTIAQLLGICSFQTGIIAGGIIIILLTVSGGLAGIAVTDSIQQIFITVMCVIVVPVIVFTKAGGIGAVFAATEPEKLSLVHGAPLGYGLGTFLALVLSYCCEPTLAHKIFASRDAKTAVRSSMTASILGFLFTIPMWTAALTKPILFPEGQMVAFLPIAMKTYLPPVLRGIGIAAFVSLLLTTGDALLLTETAIISNDILPRFHRTRTEREGLFINRFLVLVIGILAIILGLYFQSVCVVMLLFTGMYGASVFPPVLLANIMKHPPEKKVVAPCMITVALLTAAMDLFPAFPTEGVFIGVPLNIILLLTSSWVVRKRSALQPAPEI